MISQDRQRKRKANKQGMGKPPSVEESITVKAPLVMDHTPENSSVIRMISRMLVTITSL